MTKREGEYDSLHHPAASRHESRHANNSANKRTWTIALFSITTLLLFADQNLMAPSLTAIAEEFGFDEAERDRKLGGDISLAFFLLGAPASFIVGCLADTTDRSVLFAWTVFIGEGACLATYWVQTYHQLYICRAVTGFSVGGAVPLIYSTLGDLFAADDRHVVSALVSFGTGAGISVGQAVAGFLGPVYGWRLPFLVVSIPALLCALAVLLTVQDPERGAMERAVLEQGEQDEVGVALVRVSNNKFETPSSLPDISLPLESVRSTTLRPHHSIAINSRCEGQSVEQFDDMHSQNYSVFCIRDCSSHIQTTVKLLSTPTVLFALLQGAPGCIPWGIINVFLNDFLSEDRGLSVQTATATLMCFSIGHICGLFVGGAGGSRLYRMDPRYPSLLAGSTAILGCVPFWVLLNRIDSSTVGWKIAAIAFISGFGSGPTGPIIKATMTNVTLPRARGQAFALFNIFDDFGKGLGPFFVSILIIRLGGRLPAFNAAILGWVVCGLANLAVFFTVQKDEAAVQATVAAELQSTLDGSPLLVEGQQR